MSATDPDLPTQTRSIVPFSVWSWGLTPPARTIAAATHAEPGGAALHALVLYDVSHVPSGLAIMFVGTNAATDMKPSSRGSRPGDQARSRVVPVWIPVWIHTPAESGDQP